MIKKISAMQCGLFLFLSIISLKFLVFPSIFSQYAYRDLYFPVLIGLIIDLFFTIVVVNIIIKNPHLTFKELLTRAFGKTFAKIALMFLFVYFFVKGVVIVKETHNYFNETLFESINWFLFIIPLFFLMGFIMLKNFRAIGRSLQFLGPLMLLALLFTILIPLSEADFSNLLPMFENGANGIFKAVFFCSFTFGDYFVLFLFMGRINIKPNSKKTIMWYVVCADVLVFAFYVVFAGIFGNLGLNHSLALSEIIMHTMVSTSTGSINWINIMIWLFILFFEMGVMFLCSSNILTQVFKFKSRYVPMFIILSLLLLAVVYLYLSLIKTINIVTSFPFCIFVIVLQVLMPLACFVASKKLSGKNKVTLSQVYNTKVVKYQLTNISGTTTNKIFVSEKRAFKHFKTKATKSAKTKKLNSSAKKLANKSEVQNA